VAGPGGRGEHRRGARYVELAGRSQTQQEAVLIWLRVSATIRGNHLSTGGVVDHEQENEYFNPGLGAGDHSPSGHNPDGAAGAGRAGGVDARRVSPHGAGAQARRAAACEAQARRQERVEALQARGAPVWDGEHACGMRLGGWR